MEYLSIDCEMTSLDSETGSIIEFGAILDDSNNPKTYQQTPKFKRVVLHPQDKYVFGSIAADMNGRIMTIISNLLKGVDVEFESDDNFDNGYCYHFELVDQFLNWLQDIEYGTLFSSNVGGQIELLVAGKNFGTCDKLFIEKLPNFKKKFRFSHRILDPSNLYIDWENDTKPPGTAECKKRANIKGIVTHDALDDAWDVVELLRSFYLKEMGIRPLDALQQKKGIENAVRMLRGVDIG